MPTARYFPSVHLLCNLFLKQPSLPPNLTGLAEKTVHHDKMRSLNRARQSNSGWPIVRKGAEARRGEGGGRRSFNPPQNLEPDVISRRLRPARPTPEWTSLTGEPRSPRSNQKKKNPSLEVRARAAVAHDGVWEDALSSSPTFFFACVLSSP